MNPDYKALEFPMVLEELKQYALSEQAKRVLETLEPYLNEDICCRKMAETTAAREILDGCGTPPLASMSGLAGVLEQGEVGGLLMPDQLTAVARFIADSKRLASYLKRGEAFGADIASYGRGLADLTDLQKEIECAVNEDHVHDDGSTVLRSIRRKMERLEEEIKEKLGHVLKSRKQYLAENFVSKRNGRYVLPVQKKYQSQFGGTVIDTSGKGGTVFMEPFSVQSVQNELDGLALDEDAEVRRILYTLTAHVLEHAVEIRSNMDIMEILDVLFAKAKYSAALKARAVEIGGAQRLKIVQGRHPLLPEQSCVPLDLTMDERTRGIIITGPNTGGKTVSIKTVGLLTLMAQCGLHIPCGEGTYIAMRDGIWCDIGDSQSLAQNLSTFSGHITNVIRILEGASRDSLVLLDELGSGTDPAEGMGIAVAVLEELRRRGCMFLVTTHYPQVKTYAEQAEGVESARMAFDKESLRPLYRLEQGKSGDSCALYIAQRLGLAPHLLKRAKQETYGGNQTGDGSDEVMKAPRSRLSRSVPMKKTADLSDKFSMGDSVMVLPQKEIGIVYRGVDDKGEAVVQIRGEKRRVRHDRLKLQVPASQLYPPDYDFSIIFDTVENRKARHNINRKFDPTAVITYEESV